MSNSVILYATAGPLTITVNGGPQFTVPAGSKPTEYLPPNIQGPTWVGGPPPQPGVFVGGPNQMVVIGPPVDHYPQKVTIQIPFGFYVYDGDVIQIYLSSTGTGQVVWMVCINGLVYSCGPSWGQVWFDSGTTSLPPADAT
jgi:hypothetical protein